MGRGIVIAVVGVLSLFAAASATAATPPAGAATEVQRPTTRAYVSLGESHGYSIGITMPAPSVAMLYAFKLVGGPVAMELGLPALVHSAYAVRVPARLIGKGRIRANFPSLGRVALRFDPSGKRQVHRARSQCRGKRRVTEHGTFRGTIALEGEGGYFKVMDHAGEGALERSFRLVCKKGAAKQTEEGSLWDYAAPPFEARYSSATGGTDALLYAFAQQPGRSIGIRAAHYAGKPGAEIQLRVLERGGRMAIGRFALLETDTPETFTTTGPGVHPASATLAPTAPFYGEANYFENSSTSHSWTGTLGVSLPGLDLPLTGEEFKTSLCVVDPKRTPVGCDFIKPKPVRGVRAGVLMDGRRP